MIDRGRLMFGCDLSLTVTSVEMSNGKVNIHASGKVTGIPSGLTSYSLFGTDETLVCVGRIDWDSVSARIPDDMRKGDWLDVNLDFTMNPEGIIE